MPIEVKSWRANDGSLHEDECAAARRDLELLVQQSPLAENQPYARSLIDWLAEEHDAIRAHLMAIARACPNSPKDKALPETPERTLERTQEPDFTDVPSSFGDV